MIDFNLVDANGSVSVRSFKNAGLATRYANKNGLTVAKSISDTALVVIADEPTNIVDASDIDAVLLDLTASDVEPVEHKSLRDVALSFDDATVAAMREKIAKSFERRDVFEATKSDLSYQREKTRMLDAGVAVSRFFLALNIEPANVIERKVNSTGMFNAKALKKIVELARFAVTGDRRVEKVMLSFIACALLFDASNTGAAIGNNLNKSFLSNLQLDKIISDTDLAEYLADYQHKYMTGGKDTQSSQARNVLDVLGLGEIVNVDSRNRGGILINSDHDFYALFRDAFMN